MPKRLNKSKRKKPLVLPHSHTGKRMAHHHASHLPLLFIVLFVGFLLLGVHRIAQAESYTVTGKVPAPLPPSSAPISAPTEGMEFTEIPIIVDGSCPAGYLVKLTRNNIFSGSTVCTPEGTFSLETDLFVGDNELHAKVYNSTDDEGPSSPSVNVTYTPPVPVAPPPITPGEIDEGEVVTNTPSIPVTEKNQLIMKAEDELKTVIVGREVSWEVELLGGKAPYAFTVDWGDGSSDVFVRNKMGKFTVSHKYKSVKNKDYLTVKLQASDADGQKATMEVSVLVLLPFRYTIAGNMNNSIWMDPNMQKIIWIIYFGTVTIVVSVFIGEKLAVHPAIKTGKMRPRHRS